MHNRNGSGQLVEFAFSSRAAARMPVAALLRLAHQARLFNTRMAITGTFSFEDGAFSQVIEGPGEVVLALASRIMTDSRHAAIAIRSFRAIPARQFPAWSDTGFSAVSDMEAFAPVGNLHMLPGLRVFAAVPAASQTLGASAP
ncbi:BLUF domain-containing protein [Amaricoccus sp.]|uniref:BLUF domain-containing protein n=1 Tax=Amaricoccus sp. TaxID=1872485 RepID=UPI00260C1F8A|nr:BLUF domain-containing protein [uncultured Amaricoccus sp.]